MLYLRLSSSQRISGGMPQMLFRNVEGTRLESTYNAIRAQTPTAVFNKVGAESEIGFLAAARLIEECDGHWVMTSDDDVPFALRLLQGLRDLELKKKAAEDEVDRCYLGLVAELFILPNRVTVVDLLTEANRRPDEHRSDRLTLPQMQDWRRIMEYLGVGHVTGERGFSCLYSPRLVAAILQQWGQSAGLLGDFLHSRFSAYLPFETADGKLARTVCVTFDELVEDGVIELNPRPLPGLVGYANPYPLHLKFVTLRRAGHAPKYL